MQKPIIGLLESRQTYHTTQSIVRWKHAVNAFENRENPNRVLLYDMYEDILLDGQLECTWGKRVDSLLNRKLAYMRNGKNVPEIDKVLASPDIRMILREIMNAIAYGYTLLQVNDIKYDTDSECYKIVFDLVPRKHVHPEKGFECVSREQHSADRDFLYKEKPLAKYMIYAGEPTDKGIFIKAAPYVIYKRGAFGDWAQFSEMFGMPFREAIYEAYDEKTRERIQSFMKEWAAQEYLVHDRNVEVKIHETGGSSASSDIYDKFIAVCDAGISKTILGNTLTTEQGDKGARALGEVHQKEQKSKEQSDKEFVLSVLNTQFRSVLKTFGIDASGGCFYFEENDEDWNKVQTKWNVINSVAARVPVDDDYIYEATGIPKPKNYNELKEEQERRRREMLERMHDGNDPDKNEEKTPSTAKKKLASRLADFFGVALDS